MTNHKPTGKRTISLVDLLILHAIWVVPKKKKKKTIVIFSVIGLCFW